MSWHENLKQKFFHENKAFFMRKQKKSYTHITIIHVKYIWEFYDIKNLLYKAYNF